MMRLCSGWIQPVPPWMMLTAVEAPELDGWRQRERPIPVQWHRRPGPRPRTRRHERRRASRRSTRGAGRYSRSTGRRCQGMTTCEPLPSGGGDDQLLTLWPVDSLASPSVSPASKQHRKTLAGSGQPWRRSSPPSAPRGSSSRTCPVCESSASPMFSATSLGLDTEPAPATSQLARWAPHIHDDDCSQWPTPRASDADKGGRGNLISMLRHGRQSKRRYWRTPRDTGRACRTWLVGRRTRSGSNG